MSRLIVTNVETQNIKFDSDTTAFSINSSGQLNTSSIVVKGEGTATTNLQQGLAKHWTQIDQDDGSGAHAEDSLNQSSTIDHGAGDTTWNFTNPMSNDDYASQTTCNSGSWYTVSCYNDAQKTAAKDRCYTMKLNQTVADSESVFVTTHGDLA